MTQIGNTFPASSDRVKKTITAVLKPKKGKK